MKANEFVKAHGWGAAKDIIKKASFGTHCRVDTKEVICCHNEQHFYFQDLIKKGVVFINIDDLKRLVESWELVESYGGLAKAKRRLYLPIHMDSIKKAITDVESCL